MAESLVPWEAEELVCCREPSSWWRIERVMGSGPWAIDRSQQFLNDKGFGGIRENL